MADKLDTNHIEQTAMAPDDIDIEGKRRTAAGATGEV